MEKVIEFIKKYKTVIGVAALLLIFFLALSFLINDNSQYRRNEKANKIEIKALHEHNKELEKELKLAQDSAKIYHDLALFYNSKDTVYIKQIKYLQNKTNEEISHYNSLPFDSQYSIFSNLAEEYIKTGFSVNK